MTDAPEIAKEVKGAPCRERSSKPLRWRVSHVSPCVNMGVSLVTTFDWHPAESVPMLESAFCEIH